MQCFICVIYLIIYCNAQSAKYRRLSTVEVDLTHPGMVNANNGPDDIGGVPQTKDEVKVFSKPEPNGSQTEISEGELESTQEDEVVRGDAQTEQTIKSPTNKPEPSEQLYTGIKKEHVKYMVSGANGHGPPYGAVVNAMEDMSQIGDSDRLTIINPTVIVNFRGTIFNRDTDLQLGQRKKDKRRPNREGNGEARNGEVR